MALPKLATSSEFKIEKGVPMPTGWGGKKYPWDAMDVGDSVYVEGPTRSGVYASFDRVKAKTGKQFTLRPDGAGWRVWRTA